MTAAYNAVDCIGPDASQMAQFWVDGELAALQFHDIAQALIGTPHGELRSKAEHWRDLWNANKETADADYLTTLAADMRSALAAMRLDMADLGIEWQVGCRDDRPRPVPQSSSVAGGSVPWWLLALIAAGVGYGITRATR